MKRARRSWAAVGFGVACAVLLGNGAVTYHHTRELAVHERWVSHTHRVIFSLEALMSLMKDGETGQRGYLITGAPEYLEPYEAAARAADGRLADVRSLTEDNAVQQERLRRVEALVRLRLEQLARNVRLRREQGFEAAQRIVAGGDGLRAMGELRGLLSAMQSDEEALLRDRAQAAALSYHTALVSGALTTAAGVLALWLVFFLLRREAAARDAANAALERARSEAESANAAKSEFLANMSHELRTPLNAIIGYSEMLQEDAAELAPHLREDLGKINSAGRHLLALLNGVLDLSKIEAGKMDLFLEEVDVAALAREVVDTIRPLADRSGDRVVLEAGEAGRMRTDVTKLRQSLFNLLSNACKFTQGGEIRLAVRREATAGGDVVLFTVRDSGIGMSAEQLGRLFQPFTQADASTTRRYGGTGLGLAISRRFCQLLGGDISVQSEPGKGSAFTIRLPAASGALASEGAEATAPRPGRGPAVLVIDDDPAARDMMRRHLEREGFRAEVAAGGDEGLRRARELRPVAITLDVLMPGMDGWAVLSALKADPELREIPVIMISMVDDRNLGYALGVSDYLTKPVERERLGEVLRRYRCKSPPCTVLLVEDDEATRGLLRSILEREGWAVDEAQNGRVALEHVAARRPELILLDLMMPEMDGFELAAALHRDPALRAIPVVVVTARDLSAEDRRRLNGYVEHVMQKGSLDKDELLRRVRDLVAALCPPEGAA